MLIIGVLIISLKWSWTGAVSFFALFFLYHIWMLERTKSPIVHISLLSAGIPLLMDWLLRKPIKEAQEAYRGD